MKPFLVLGLAAILVVQFCIPLGFAADNREILVIPEKARTKFVMEMGSHLQGFDEILAAIAEGDFKGAARIAETHLNFGRNIWSEMAGRGMSGEQIAKIRKRYQGMSLAERQKMESEMGVGGKARISRSFDSTVQLFYSAAGNFADVAKNVGDEPTLADYENVIESLREITSICRGCHGTFCLQ